MIADGAMTHLAHHRGQLTVYLRLLETKVPAIYGPSADESVLTTLVVEQASSAPPRQPLSDSPQSRQSRTNVPLHALSHQRKPVMARSSKDPDDDVLGMCS